MDSLSQNQKEIVLDFIARNLKPGVRIHYTKYESGLKLACIYVYRSGWINDPLGIRVYFFRDKKVVLQDNKRVHNYTFPLLEEKENISLILMDDILSTCFLLLESSFEINIGKEFFRIETLKFKAALDPSETNWKIRVKDAVMGGKVCIYFRYSPLLYSFVLKESLFK